MPMLRGFLILVLFFLLGEALRMLFVLPVSGGVLGMILMTLTLMLRGRVSDDLATASQALISVLVLLIMPGVVSSLLIAFTISLDEFVIAFFLSGTEPTLPVYIWSQLRFPQRIPSVMALGTLLLLLSVVLLTFSEVLRRRSARRLGKDMNGGVL